MNKRQKQLSFFFSIVIAIVGLVVIFTVIGPEELVQRIGIENSYLLAFFISLFGGFSAGGSASFISIVMGLAAGGLNPIILGVISGVALTIGDTIMFLMGKKGRELVSGTWKKRIERLADSIKHKPRLQKAIPFVAAIYIAFAPLPNDLMLFFMAAINYPTKRMFLIILVGDLAFALLITHLAVMGITSIL